MMMATGFAGAARTFAVPALIIAGFIVSPTSAVPSIASGAAAASTEAPALGLDYFQRNSIDIAPQVASAIATTWNRTPTQREGLPAPRVEDSGETFAQLTARALTARGSAADIWLEFGHAMPSRQLKRHYGAYLRQILEARFAELTYATPATRMPAAAAIDELNALADGSRTDGLVEAYDKALRALNPVVTEDKAARPVGCGRHCESDGFSDADATAAVVNAHGGVALSSNCWLINWGTWSAGNTPPPPARGSIAAGGWLGFVATANATKTGGIVHYYACY